jgi:hypothetical protein
VEAPDLTDNNIKSIDVKILVDGIYFIIKIILMV